MSPIEQAQYILQLPLAEWKAIKKAVQTLKRSGMDGEQALCILLQAHRENYVHRGR